MKKYLPILLICLSCSEQTTIEAKLDMLDSPTKSLLQAISMVDAKTTWMSGHNSEFVTTSDGGDTWELFHHPTIDTLEFRDVHAFSENEAILMSAGPGSLSRIYSFKKPDVWKETFVMSEKEGFLDCISFWDTKRGVAYGDAIDEYPYILLTHDGGLSWTRADSLGLPKSGKGEGGFAASGTCVTTGKNGKAWIATGAGGNARILVTDDYGHSWKVIESPLVKGEAAGNTSISFAGEVGFLTGGDLLISDEYTDNCAFSMDGGESWTLSNHPITKGAFYGGSITKFEEVVFAFACRPNGLDFTRDTGKSWVNLDTLNYWAVEVKGATGYACGMEGKILRISLHP